MSVPVLDPHLFDVAETAEALRTTGYLSVDGLVPDAVLDGLLAEARALDRSGGLSKAGVGRGSEHGLQNDIRTDRTKWLDGGTDAQRALLARFEQIRVEMNRELMLGLFEVEAHFASYGPGDFYKRHLDSFRGAKNRLLSVVLYLNPAWRPQDAGELLIFENETGSAPVGAVEPRHGRAVIFLSEEIPHEVVPAARQRYSIAAWFRCRSS